ncbi:MAG: hypothetical protein AAGI01_08625 [Myxococcota bacterium]
MLSVLRRITEAVCTPLDVLPPWLALTLFSILSAVLALWIVRLTIPPGKLQRARDLMTSAIYELRLYIDSPRRVFAAQGRMLLWSFAYTAWIGLPMLVLGLPLGVLFLHLEARWALEPLPLEEPLLVEVAVGDGCDGKRVEVVGGEHVTMTTPALFHERDGVVYQSFTIAKSETTELTITGCGEPVRKRLDAASYRGPYSPTRTKGARLLWSLTDEEALDGASTIDYVHVDHPARDQEWFGLAVPWWLAWLVLTTVAAIALQRPMKVVL